MKKRFVSKLNVDVPIYTTIRDTLTGKPVLTIMRPHTDEHAPNPYGDHDVHRDVVDDLVDALNRADRKRVDPPHWLVMVGLLMAKGGR